MPSQSAWHVVLVSACMMEMPQQSSLKFKFPAHIISLVVRTTGCRLGRDKLVAIGAAFVKVPNSRTLPQILEKRMFQCQVDAQEALDANCMTADELKQLQGEAKPTAQAVAQVVAFVKDCMRQDHDSFIAANNPVSSLTIFSPPAAIDHAQLLLHSGASARSCHSLVCMPPDGGTWQRQSTARASRPCRALQRRPGAEIKCGHP
jgi:hypothetical protein